MRRMLRDGEESKGDEEVLKKTDGATKGRDRGRPEEDRENRKEAGRVVGVSVPCRMCNCRAFNSAAERDSCGAARVPLRLLFFRAVNHPRGTPALTNTFPRPDDRHTNN